MGESCTLGGVQAKVPGQLEAGQARFNLEKKFTFKKKLNGEYFARVRTFVALA
jgi:hypothetical protein